MLDTIGPDDPFIITIPGFPNVDPVPTEALMLVHAVHNPSCSAGQRRRADRKLDRIGLKASCDAYVRLRAMFDAIDVDGSRCAAMCKDKTATTILIPECLMDAAAVAPLDFTKGFNDAALADRALAIKATEDGGAK